MKNLLVIAYYFPPSGGPGVQRVLKLIKYIREFGWNPIILTVKDAQYQALDYSLLEEIPQNCKIYKTKIFEPYDIYRFFTGREKSQPIDVNNIKKESQKRNFKERVAEFIRATFFIPDARVSWYFAAKSTLKQIFEENQIDAVYSSSPPYTCSLIAKYVKKKYNIPWVAGFRDPWTDFLTTPKRWFLPKFIDKKLEKSVFLTADFVECAWEGIIKDAINKYPELEKSKFFHNPNGFDSADYPEMEENSNERFTLTYTGSLYGRRNPDSLFQAIEKLIDEKVIGLENFTLQFVGRFGSEIQNMFENTKLKDNIQVVSYLPHSESLKKLLQSDALLLIVDEAKESEEIVPGKVYEYLGTRKPLLVISPENGAVADLMKETGAGLVAHQTQIAKIADNFLNLYTLWKNNQKLSSIKEENIKKYERRESAKHLAELLEIITKKP